MDYSEIFTAQWKTFCNDFKINAVRRKDTGLKADKLDEWYALNIHRWESSIETEGSILEQQNSREFIDRFLAQLKAFRFVDVQTLADKKPVMRGCVMVLAGFVLGILAYLVLPVSAVFRFLIIIVVIGFSVMNALQGVQKSKEIEYERVRKEFLKQLTEHGDKLVSLCRSYE